MSEHYKKISQFLSFILRHKPSSIGLELDIEGWVDIGNLIAKAQLAGRGLDHALITAVVAQSDKKRFAISADGLRIRAVQGHSISAVSIQYEARMPPPVLFHGTADRFLPSILKHGLKPAQRLHVHLSSDETTAMTVGARHGKAVVITVDAQGMHRDQLRLRQADNGVWLTDFVPSKYLSHKHS